MSVGKSLPSADVSPALSYTDSKSVGAVMVVGGGIAGMQASLDLAEAGFKVYLVEKQPAIGGHMAALDKTFPTNDCAMCTISPRLVETASHPNIVLLTDTEVRKLEGEAGNFVATVTRKPRFIDTSKCTACGECAVACPVRLPDAFNGGLSQRKAAYKLYPQAVPNAYAIEKKGVAPCRDACPAGQRAQGYIAMIREGRYEEALRVIKEDNPFPGICGRICNHRCETACNRNLVDEPVAIAALKRFVTDQIYSKPYLPPEPAERKYKERVAIVGSGPCGLTAAHDLTMAGYGVTVFEALPVAGGMLRVGVPEYRLPTWIVNREIQEIIDLGVELRLNTRVENLEELFSDGFQAVLLAVGAHQGKRLPIPNASHPEAHTAVEFLRDVRLGNSIDLKGRHVLVLGGGNVAIDCARTSVRLGARRVDMACLEGRDTMPADLGEILEAEEEGITIFPDRSFTQLMSDNGRLWGVEAVKVKYMRFEPDGRLTLETLPGSEHMLAADVVIFSIGQRAAVDFFRSDVTKGDGIGITRPGFVAVDGESYATGRPGVFAAGDATTGTTFVVDAIAAGHRAAGNIIGYLQGVPAKRTEGHLPVARLEPADLDARIQNGDIRLAPRVHMPALESELRRHSFEEISYGYSEEQARAEAERCLQCGVCSECLACAYKCAAGAIQHEQTMRDEQIEVGAVILASGFEAYDARATGEYGYGRYPNVITSLQFERILSPSGPTQGHLKRPSDGGEPRKIAWIQCVGSRQAERNWCSAVCCMYATKQTLIAQEHAPGVECTIFYIDFRAYGKSFDAYYERARQSGVRYIRAMPSMIRQSRETGDLQVQFALPGGGLNSETFDMVVLSQGLQAPSGSSRLASDLEVALFPSGYCRTQTDAPLDTTRPGVYVCGAFGEPKDIPETVMSASAAAARAMTLLAEARYSLVQPKEYPAEIDVSNLGPRIGVFVCHCGSNIASVVDVQGVAEYARQLPDVVHSDHFMFACSTDSQARIQTAIQEHALNRVVVASCTPRTHEPLFQNAIREAGLNFYLFEMANIRDQCSWVHRDFPEEATQKAKDLARMAVAKVRLSEPLQRKTLAFNRDALVIGGGLAGMTAALELADQGFSVSLVERQESLGGNMHRLRYLLGEIDPQELLARMVARTLEHPRVHTHLETEVVASEGSLGKFKSTLLYAGKETTVVNHGVTIVAIGAQPYLPTEFLYGQDERVITQMELENLIHPELSEKNGKGLIQGNGRTSLAGVKSLVMIQCVGSRNAERAYCSRLCCGQAVKNALQVKAVSPETEVYILYQDMRTYGLSEQSFRQARQAGVLFLRYEAERLPVVRQEPQGEGRSSLQVLVHDAMLEADIVLPADLLVLSVATVPQPDAGRLAQLLKVPRNQDGFFQEAHLKLRPVDFASEGIYVCGMAHYPKRAVTESMVQALAAAGRAATVLSKQEIEIEPIISHVIEEKCDGCAYCVDPCPFKAISLLEYTTEAGQIKKRVQVDEALCKGCGTCQATCPKAAIYISHFRLEQLRAMTMAALGR